MIRLLWLSLSLRDRRFFLIGLTERHVCMRKAAQAKAAAPTGVRQLRAVRTPSDSQKRFRFALATPSNPAKTHTDGNSVPPILMVVGAAGFEPAIS